MLTKPKRENLLKNHKGQYRYLFNFTNGGFNDVWAKDIKEFRSEIKRQFGDCKNLHVNYNTLYKATLAQSQNWDRMGNMMCW
jgi:hypothetical protein